jgi:hypothetical protein
MLVKRDAVGSRSSGLYSTLWVSLQPVKVISRHIGSKKDALDNDLVIYINYKKRGSSWLPLFYYKVKHLSDQYPGFC